MIRIFSTASHPEFAMIQTVLERAQIKFAPMGDGFSHTEDVFGPMSILVGEEDAQRAREAIQDYLESIKDKGSN